MIVLVVGDVATDTIIRLPSHAALRRGSDTTAEIRDTPGGQGANVARWLASTGLVTPRLFACVSSHDANAAHTMDAALTAAGINPHLVVVDAPPARVISVVEPDGSERSFYTQRGAAALLSSDHVDESVIDGIGWCHISGYLLSTPTGRECFERLLVLCGAANIPVSLDPASVSVIEDLGLERWRTCVSHVALLLPNAAEAIFLSGASDLTTAAMTLRSLAETVVVTDGMNGSLGATSNGVTLLPADTVTAVDPTGAGDAFAAGLIAALATGANLSTGVASATDVAARCVSKIGANP